MSHSFHSPDATTNSVGLFSAKIELEINLSTVNNGSVPFALKLKSTKTAKWLGTEFYQEQLTGPKEDLPLLDGFIRKGTRVIDLKGTKKRVDNKIAKIVTIDIDSDYHMILLQRVPIIAANGYPGIFLSVSASGKYKAHMIVSCFNEDGTRNIAKHEWLCHKLAGILGLEKGTYDIQGCERCFLTESLCTALASGVHTPIMLSTIKAWPDYRPSAIPVDITALPSKKRPVMLRVVGHSFVAVDEDGSYVETSEETRIEMLKDQTRAIIASAPPGFNWEDTKEDDGSEIPEHKDTAVTRENMLSYKKFLSGKVPVVGKALELLALHFVFWHDGKTWLAPKLARSVLESSKAYYYELREMLVRLGLITMVEKSVANKLAARFVINPEFLEQYKDELEAIRKTIVTSNSKLTAYIEKHKDTMVAGEFNHHEVSLCVIAVSKGHIIEDIVQALGDIPEWFTEKRLKRLMRTFKWAERKVVR